MTKFISMTNKKFLWCALGFGGGLWITTLALWLARNDGGDFLRVFERFFGALVGGGIFVECARGFVGIFVFDEQKQENLGKNSNFLSNLYEFSAFWNEICLQRRSSVDF